jgi:hypothetical protein
MLQKNAVLPKVVENFLSTIEEACAGLHDDYGEDARTAMLEISDLVVDLEPLSRLGNILKKSGPEVVALLKKHCILFSKKALAVRDIYPQVDTVWLKLHVVEDHFWRFAEQHGMRGKVNAQGVESTHVIINAQERMARCIPRKYEKALFLFRQTATYNSSDVTEIHHEFKSKRVHQKTGRKKVV